MCNIVFLFESMKSCKNDRQDENLVNIRPRVKAISPKVFIGVLLSIRDRIWQVLKVCNVVLPFKSIKNCKNDRLFKFIKMIKT